MSIAMTSTSEEVAAQIRQRLSDLGMTQKELGARVAAEEGSPTPFVQASVSGWVSDPEMLRPSRLFAIERVLGVAPGTYSRPLGYLPVELGAVARTVPEVIEADAKLDDFSRRVLLATYRSFVAELRHARER